MSKTAIEIMPGRNRKRLLFALAAFVLLTGPLALQADWLRIYTMTGIYVMLALGLNVVAGFAGLLDLAYVAFFGMGAYFFALLSSGWSGFHFPFLVAFPLSAMATMVTGFALGSTGLRTKGAYLAVLTLAFSQIFRLLLVNLDRPINITGGIHGLHNFEPIRLFGLQIVSDSAYAYLIWWAAIPVILACFHLKRSHLGRAWEAVREDEAAAEAVGLNPSMMRLKAFSFGALIAGATGALFASFQGALFPGIFDFPQLMIIYAMVILGGLGNVAGVIAGAILLSILSAFLREYGPYAMMLYGIIPVALMALRPRGVMSAIKFFKEEREETHEKEVSNLDPSLPICLSLKRKRRRREEGGSGKNQRIVLQIQEVSLNIGGIVALDHVSFSVREREILAIVGPNGAGKTALLNVISGFYPAGSGTVLFEDKNATGFKPHRIVRAGIARTFQNDRLFNTMTVLDNVKTARFWTTRSGLLSSLFAFSYRRREEEKTDREAKGVLAFFGERLAGGQFDRPASLLSRGDRKRLEIARALATGARVILLDEPSAGMNPQETEEITTFIKELRDRHGYTIIVIEHKLNVVKSISDRVIAIDCGRKIAEGSFHELADNPQVIEAYLGRKKH